MQQREVEEACVTFGYRFAIIRQEPGAEPRIVAAYRRFDEAREEFGNARATYATEGASFFIREL